MELKKSAEMFSDINCGHCCVCKLFAENIISLKPDGIFLSNGLGDPAATGKICYSNNKN